MTYIGIDTGIHTGIASWDNRRRKFDFVKTVKIHKAMEMVKARVDLHKMGVEDKVIIRVEDPRKRTWFNTDRMSREDERKKLQGVGSVKRDASIWEDFLTDIGAEFEMVHPKQNVTKLTQENFKNITGWTERTNEHCRDAAMLVFGF